MFNKYIKKIKSNFISIYQLLHNWKFVKRVCEKNGIKNVNGKIKALLEESVRMAGILNLSEDQLYGMIVDGLDKLSECDGIKKLIQGVVDDFKIEASKFDKATHFIMYHSLSLGAVASYLLEVLKETGIKFK